MKHRFLNVKYETDYTKKADDLYEAYAFMYANTLIQQNLMAAHKLLSKNLLNESQRGVIRSNTMFVVNENDRIEYVACDSVHVKSELNKLFNDIEILLSSELTIVEIFYFA